MVITFTLVGLLLSLVLILVISFYMNEEGFAQMEQEKKKEEKKENFEDKKEEKKEHFEDKKTDKKEGFTNVPLSGTVAPTGSANAANTAAAVTSAPSTPSNVPVSDQAYQAMDKNQRAGLLRDIQKVIRNELIANRALERLEHDSDDEEDDEEESDATAQGQDYRKNSCKKEDECATNSQCDPLVDMTKYIRKDQIPCWGCNIDY